MLGIVFKLLWNWLMPVFFGLGEISYWQAFGLALLSKLLFGALGHRHREHAHDFHKKFYGWKEGQFSRITSVG